MMVATAVAFRTGGCNAPSIRHTASSHSLLTYPGTVRGSRTENCESMRNVPFWVMPEAEPMLPSTSPK
jgi:hypothetical protein